MRCSVLYPTSCAVSAEVYNGLNTEGKGNRQHGGSDDEMIKNEEKEYACRSAARIGELQGNGCCGELVKTAVFIYAN